MLAVKSATVVLYFSWMLIIVRMRQERARALLGDAQDKPCRVESAYAAAMREKFNTVASQFMPVAEVCEAVGRLAIAAADATNDYVRERMTERNRQPNGNIMGFRCQACSDGKAPGADHELACFSHVSATALPIEFPPATAERVGTLVMCDGNYYTCRKVANSVTESNGNGDTCSSEGYEWVKVLDSIVSCDLCEARFPAGLKPQETPHMSTCPARIKKRLVAVSEDGTTSERTKYATDVARMSDDQLNAEIDRFVQSCPPPFVMAAAIEPAKIASDTVTATGSIVERNREKEEARARAFGARSQIAHYHLCCSCDKRIYGRD